MMIEQLNKKKEKMKIKFAPTLLCMDLLRVGDQIKVLNNFADFYHIDIMDYQFVRNLGFSMSFVETIMPVVKAPVECHLMVKNPEEFIEPLAQMGVKYIQMHAETIITGAFRLIDKIHDKGCSVGIVLNPATPIETVMPYIHLVDQLLLMTIEPGFPATRFLYEMLDKIRAARDIREKNGLKYLIEIDGSCSDDNIASIISAGTDEVVVGTAALFSRDPDIEKAWRLMIENFEKALRIGR